MALVLVIARLCDPSSELSIAENFLRKTALSDLLGVSAKKVYDNRLYRAVRAGLRPAAKHCHLRRLAVPRRGSRPGGRGAESVHN